MRILFVASLFPPNVLGGAELCAYNLAAWLAARGHEVGVVTTAPTRSDALDGAPVDGMPTWRVSIPRAYTVFEAAGGAPAWKRPLWHLQDHFDPRNRRALGRVLDAFRPDVVNVHVLHGLGYNALAALGRRDIPTVFTLHDLGLACLKMTMYRGGDCGRRCALCSVSASIKGLHLDGVPRLGFISPSRANLARLADLPQVARRPQAHILNANAYPAPTNKRTRSDTVRFVYAGRLHETKGVGLLLRVMARVAATRAFTLTVVGTGPEEEGLRAAYGGRAWVRFTGHVPVQAVADIMNDGDLLLAPSIWAENSPGVIIQALSLSLPVMGSRIGGIPELVEDGENGVLVPPGDEDAWFAAIVAVLDRPDRLEGYRRRAERRAPEYDQDRLAGAALRFFGTVMEGADRHAGPDGPSGGAADDHEAAGVAGQNSTGPMRSVRVTAGAPAAGT